MPETTESAGRRDEVGWRVHGAGEPLRLVLVLLVAAGALVLAFLLWGPPWALLALGVLFLSLANFFFPTRFSLTDDGVTVRKIFNTTLRPWDEFRRVDLLSNGIFLGTTSRRSVIDNWRGLFLPGGHRVEGAVEFARTRVRDREKR